MTRTFSRPSASRIGIEGRPCSVPLNERRTTREIANNKAIATTIATQIATKKKPAIRKNATMGMMTRRKMITRILYLMEFMGEIEGSVRSALEEGGSCMAGVTRGSQGGHKGITRRSQGDRKGIARGS